MAFLIFFSIYGIFHSIRTADSWDRIEFEYSMISMDLCSMDDDKLQRINLKMEETKKLEPI